MECGKQNIKIVEGNEFALVLPLKQRTFVASTPIDEDIVYADLQDVVLKIGDTQFTATLETYGVQVLVPYDALTRGTYDILLTATYHGSEIRASYFEALTIVQYNSQSDAQQYIAGSPIVLDAAYVIGGTLTDAELEALKEEYREKNAQLQQAIEDAEAAKAEWEQKAADLDGVAQESTSQSILTAVENIDIDTSDLAKEATLGTPLVGQPSTIFAAIAAVGGGGGGDAQESTSQEILASVNEIISAHIFNSSMDGYVFTNLANPTAGCVLFQATNLIEINDNDMTSLSLAANYLNALAPNLKKVTFNKVTELLSQPFRAANQIEELYLPELSRPASDSLFNMARCRVLHIPKVLVSYIPSLSFHYNLIDLMIGANMVSNFNISSWNASEPLLANSQSLLTPEDIAAGFTSNLEKLLYNIREHIAGILIDRTGQPSLTITFNGAYKAAIQADTATSDAFTNKNWIIA